MFITNIYITMYLKIYFIIYDLLLLFNILRMSVLAAFKQKSHIGSKQFWIWNLFALEETLHIYVSKFLVPKNKLNILIPRTWEIMRFGCKIYWVSSE